MGINRNTADITRNAVAKSGDTMTGTLVFTAGTAASPSISFTGDTDTGIYSSGANAIGFTVGGAAVCGISSTYISSAAPFIAPAGSASAPGYLFQGDPSTGIYSSGANNITFTTNSTARMQLNNSGLCIGDYLAASYPLEVWKNSDSILARFARGGATNNPRLEVSAVEATKTLTLDATGSTTPNLEIKTGGTARMAINTTGQVGIGTSPNANYALATDVYYTGAASIGLVNIGRSGGDYPSIGYNFRTTSTSGSYLYNATDLASRLEFYTGGFRFFPTNSSGTSGAAITPATSHYFRPDGRVGFNSSGDANYTFTINSFSNSGSHYAFNVANVGWSLNMFGVLGDGMIVSSPTYNTFTTSNAANMYVNSTGGFYRSTSSIKYKTQVEDLDPTYVDKLLDLRPVWYRSTCEADRKDWSWYGFIAEELAAIEPRFVDYKQNEDGTLEPEGIQYSRIVVPLVALVQKQQQQINTQQQQINDLLARVAALEGQMS